MTQLNCEYIRDVYPDVLNGKAERGIADAVRSHVASCDDCSAEIALLDALHVHATPAPAALHERVATAVAEKRSRRRFSRGDMAMAATLAAALIGGSVIMRSQQEPKRAVEPAQQQAVAAHGVGFVGVEDAMLSGVTSLENLSVEQLEKLLGEMES